MPEWKSLIKERLAGLQFSATREAEIIEEMSQHLEDHYSELRQLGNTAEEAYSKTTVELENSQLLKRELNRVEVHIEMEPIVFGARKMNMMTDILQDLRFGLRAMRKNPVFTVVVVITLALGIGANTLIFSLVNGVLLQPLPYPQADRLVKVTQSYKKFGLENWLLSDPNFLGYRDNSTSFDSIAAYTTNGANMTWGGEPERVNTSTVTAEFFK